MLQKLSSYFSRRAGAVVLAGAVIAANSGCGGDHKPVAPKNDDLNISTLVPTGKSCFFLSDATNPKTPVEQYWAKQYSELQKTKTGSLLVNASDPEPLRVCYDRELDKENACGFYRSGTYNGILSLNPAERVSDSKRSFATVHEMRHHFQGNLNLDYSFGKNVPERERVVMYWLIEGDARVAGLLYSFEQAERGDESYLRDLNHDQKMIDAFYKTLNAEKTNVVDAARAAMLAFLEEKDYMTLYANLTLDWVNRAHKGLDRSQVITPFLETGALLKMGETAYGNYMTEDVIGAFNKAFSDVDYQTLKMVRAQKSKGPVCE